MFSGISSPNNMEHLPESLLLHVLIFLSPSSYQVISRVCKEWNESTRCDWLWEHWFARRFSRQARDLLQSSFLSAQHRPIPSSLSSSSSANSQSLARQTAYARVRASTSSLSLSPSLDPRAENGSPNIRPALTANADLDAGGGTGLDDEFLSFSLSSRGSNSNSNSSSSSSGGLFSFSDILPALASSPSLLPIEMGGGRLSNSSPSLLDLQQQNGSNNSNSNSNINNNNNNSNRGSTHSLPMVIRRLSFIEDSNSTSTSSSSATALSSATEATGGNADDENGVQWKRMYQERLELRGWAKRISHTLSAKRSGGPSPKGSPKISPRGSPKLVALGDPLPLADSTAGSGHRSTPLSSTGGGAYGRGNASQRDRDRESEYSMMTAPVTNGVVSSLVFDQSRLVYADGSLVRIYSLKTDSPLATIQDCSSPVTCLDFHSSLLVLGSADRSIRWYDWETLSHMRTTSKKHGHTSPLTAVKLSMGNPTFLLSASIIPTVKIWDNNTGQCVTTLDGSKRMAGIHATELMSNPQEFFTGGAASTYNPSAPSSSSSPPAGCLCRWDTRVGSMPANSGGPTNAGALVAGCRTKHILSSIAVHPDSYHVAVGDVAGNVSVFDFRMLGPSAFRTAAVESGGGSGSGSGNAAGIGAVYSVHIDDTKLLSLRPHLLALHHRTNCSSDSFLAGSLSLPAIDPRHPNVATRTFQCMKFSPELNYLGLATSDMVGLWRPPPPPRSGALYAFGSLSLSPSIGPIAVTNALAAFAPLPPSAAAAVAGMGSAMVAMPSGDYVSTSALALAPAPALPTTTPLQTASPGIDGIVSAQVVVQQWRQVKIITGRPNKRGSLEGFSLPPAILSNSLASLTTSSSLSSLSSSTSSSSALASSASSASPAQRQPLSQGRRSSGLTVASSFASPSATTTTVGGGSPGSPVPLASSSPAPASSTSSSSSRAGPRGTRGRTQPKAKGRLRAQSQR